MISSLNFVARATIVSLASSLAVSVASGQQAAPVGEITLAKPTDNDMSKSSTLGNLSGSPAVFAAAPGTNPSMEPVKQSEPKPKAQTPAGPAKVLAVRAQPEKQAESKPKAKAPTTPPKVLAVEAESSGVQPAQSASQPKSKNKAPVSPPKVLAVAAEPVSGSSPAQPVAEAQPKSAPKAKAPATPPKVLAVEAEKPAAAPLPAENMSESSAKSPTENTVKMANDEHLNQLHYHHYHSSAPSRFITQMLSGYAGMATVLGVIMGSCLVLVI